MCSMTSAQHVINKSCVKKLNREAGNKLVELVILIFGIHSFHLLKTFAKHEVQQLKLVGHSLFKKLGFGLLYLCYLLFSSNAECFSGGSAIILYLNADIDAFLKIIFIKSNKLVINGAH